DGSATYPPLNDLPADLGDSWFRNFVPPPMASQPGATAVFVTGGLGPSTTWSVGSRCRISLALSPDSTPDERTVEGCTATLRDIAISGNTGWAVGDRGTVLRSTDGGHSWERVTFPTQAALTAVLLSSGAERVTVFGDGDTVRWSDDGGLTWRGPQNRLYPAPWCFFAVALSLVLGAAGARTKIPPEVVGSHIEDLLASDAPITDERQDVLGQAQVARTIAYFLQNDRTEAPLTLAVTGEWGSGKSSVLNLVHKRLKRSGMPVIRFNAWHHQQDADPLAALYASIVKGAVPRVPALAEYRLRLLARRWRRRAWMLAVIALLGSFLFGLYFKAPHYSHDAFQSIAPIVTCFFSDCPELDAKKEAAKAAGGETSQVEKAHAHTFWGGGLATLVLVAPILASLLRSLRSFGVNPSTLLRAVSGKGGDDRELLTFHAQFADEFDDVTWALGRRRLVLLIDDLDRCAPDNLLKVLEAMNFLVSSGKCFVVLAMSRGIVLEALATQLPEAGGGTPAERADRYLQKLINVEVALPQLSPHHGKTLITGASAAPGTSVEEPAERSPISRLAAWGLGVAVALTVGIVMFNAGAKLGEAAEDTLGVAEAAEPPPEEALASAARPPPPPVSSTHAGEEKGKQRGDVRPAQSPVAPAARPPASPVRLPERWTIEEPPRPTRSLWAVLPWVFLVWAGLLSLAVSSSPRPMTTDSRDFREALERWCEVIQLRQPTPRALKRFLNRLRFWAMRLRAEKEPVQVVSPWQRLFSRGPQARGDPEAMSEAALVALAALHEVHAELVTEPGALSGALEAEPAAVKAALDAERKASGHPTEEDRLKFLELLGTVKA
ncbi:MAG TPA: P-loop NTPase fold protein, partial [Myxococcaceae bacterium]|nr:P-loop NTPase fold protein [Myxococcaceae bacterium]